LILIIFKGRGIAPETLPAGLLLVMKLDRILMAGLSMMRTEGGKLGGAAIRAVFIHLMI
jgi:hypothetical protein